MAVSNGEKDVRSAKTPIRKKINNIIPITIAIIISIGIEAAEAAAVAAFPEEAPAARLDFSAVPPAVSTVFLPAFCAIPCGAVVAFPDESVALPLAAACDPALPAALLPCLFFILLYRFREESIWSSVFKGC